MKPHGGEGGSRASHDGQRNQMGVGDTVAGGTHDGRSTAASWGASLHSLVSTAQIWGASAGF